MNDINQIQFNSDKSTFAKRRIPFLAIFLILTFQLSAYNLRQLSSKEGLSNSAILSICQDNERFMWFGSCDGLNMYDGLNIQVYKPTINNPNSLSGNLIEGIMEAENGILWIATNHGLNRLDKKKRTIEYHNEYQGKYHYTKTKNNDVFTIHEDNLINYYDKNKKTFVQIPFKGINNMQIQCFLIDDNNIMWIFSDNGKILKISVSLENDRLPIFKLLHDYKNENNLLYVFEEKNQVYYVDDQFNLFELNLLTDKKSFIINLKNEIEGNGIISDIIKDDEDYLVAFQTNGLIRLVNTPENMIKFYVKRINIYCGVFSLCKDELQDIIWIGTDGQGVYMYSKDSFSLRSTIFNDLPFQIQKPVRTLLLDSLNNLWIGTKDDGILLINNFPINETIHPDEISHYTTNNSLLTNNSIYAFAKSRRNLIWIGGDGPGLNYYSYKDKTIKRIYSKDKKEIIYVHSICEVNDSVLWLSTVGSGIVKVTISGSDDNPQIESIDHMMFTKGEPSYNYFFSAYKENDSILWFGNRGYGIQLLNTNTKTFKSIKFHKKGIETINDILSIHKDKQGAMWFGSSFGITRLQHYNDSTFFYENYNEIETGLPNNTIHGILEDKQGYLWLSTNNGIVQFNPETKDFRVYNHQNGLDVVEFSDGAYFRDEKTGTLFFGGTNGFVTITQDIFKEKKFIPQIFFTGLKIYENEYNLADFMKKYKNEEFMELPYDQNFFSISFIALDYINGQNGTYSYYLENFDDKWINKGYANSVTFTKVPPGEYILHVKYNNGKDNLPGDIYSLRIVIIPPWYLTKWAYAAYAILIIGILFLVAKVVRKRYRLKRESMIEKLNQQQKEEIYESKLRFFTNITHEFCTPLTLIYGPCDRILTNSNSNPLIKKYALLIQRNAERLNTLIQELIEFRRIETGHKDCVIEQLAISDFSRNIADSFLELADSRKIEYIIHIPSDIFWNTDKGCFTKILTNLISNAFKYTPNEGTIEFKLSGKNDLLELEVINTGKGIKEENIPLIFNRYSVLENFEKQTEKGLSSRNGLGLAICHNMVKLLSGEIEVSSKPNEFTEFKVTLPVLPLSYNGKETTATNVLPVVDNNTPVVEAGAYQFLKSRSTILIVDDDPEILWLLAEIFTENYNVIPIQDSEKVMEVLNQKQPDLIISDVMMPKLDGITLTRLIKENKHTTHIPLILLSAKNMPEDQAEGIEAGAETYVTKPFNVEYLKSLVDRHLKRKADLEKYYTSALSVFKLEDGRFIHKEDRDFFEKMMKIIDGNIANPDLSTSFIALNLGVSSRHLYRKLKNITEETPADIIKEYKLTIAEKLLVTSNLSIDEIIYKSGFGNRGNFFRIFSSKYGITPKNYREQKKRELKN